MCHFNRWMHMPRNGYFKNLLFFISVSLWDQYHIIGDWTNLHIIVGPRNTNRLFTIFETRQWEFTIANFGGFYECFRDKRVQNKCVQSSLIIYSFHICEFILLQINCISASLVWDCYLTWNVKSSVKQKSQCNKFMKTLQPSFSVTIF